MFRLLLIFSYFVLFSAESASEYDLNILHYNDFHARFVETSPTGTACNPSNSPCIGGFARLATLVRERLISEPYSLLLNAGDSFQGTIWYNILRWNVTQDFMNMLPHDAHVLIVQAAAFTQYLGEIKLTFDESGKLLRWAGNPHYIGNEIVQAPDVVEKINKYLPGIEEKANEKIGTSLVELSSNCTCAECNYGNFICDAFMFAALPKAGPNTWNYAHFCAINRGVIRANIEEGVITYESVMVSNPFLNNVEVFDLKGKHVLEMLEFAVANVPWPGARMMQVSGLRATFDGSLPVNSRVLNVTVRCIECDIPRYEPLDLEKYYKVVSQSFIGNGGDGYTMISENRKNIEVLGVDYDILMKYIRHQSPVFVDTDGRITITNACQV
ncbi:hypothetical protein PYW08_008813 [Mythimna loreyi]|uniref:Uncharacterized protein n=1 Tax=Mythimna loreyi TaxID=667449 RepID=A0ACC2QA17_9NEOP|nr:hypothetical protein PYW08_008813 [Mythimna loreyi]